ncbi:hypothetical protein GJ744_004572 [Endocarpon pusillum]|uniref:PiggyBac transposable element-derived protein domain-containing protein n=1 Tax=Endocarpon pusillum TaxID=364733 RepID=A0A8H7ALR8_9EURO|nr:hypothetical protein GJ744_004572 [Endocarpon pusillum]
MTTIHDPTMEEDTYFERIKRPGASLKLALDAETANTANSINTTKFTCPALPAPPANSTPQYLQKLYALEHYNKEMGGSDNHAKLNSYNSVSRHYHRRNWLPLFYLLIDAVVTNAYILYKLGKKGRKLSHAQFQEEIAQALLRGPGAVLRRRQQPRPPQAIYNLHTRPV